MPYTKVGPFTNGSNVPPINATFLNGIETTLVTLTAGNASNAVSPVTGWYHIDSYGAKPDGTDSKLTIQAAIDAANTAYTTTGTVQTVYVPPGVFTVGWRDYGSAGGSADGSAVGVILKNGVWITGPGTLKVQNGVNGGNTHYACIRSLPAGLTNAGIRDITVTGNRANQATSQQCNNIELLAASNIRIQDVKSLDANGNGIMVYGTTSAPATNITIIGCTANGANTIGIQVSQANGVQILNNYITGTSDNCIDVYGENGTTSAQETNFLIAGNRTQGGLTGAFIETIAVGNVTGNHFKDSLDAGVHVNRINGAPAQITIVNNTIDYIPNGITITGDTGGVTIRANTISRASQAGVRMGGGGGRVSQVYIDHNTIDTLTANAIPLVLIPSVTNQVANVIHRGTITMNTNRSWDTVNQAAATVSCTFQAALSPGS